MTFEEWMNISEKAIGKEGMSIFNEFANGKISFQECVNKMYELMPSENQEALVYLMKEVGGHE